MAILSAYNRPQTLQPTSAFAVSCLLCSEGKEVAGARASPRPGDPPSQDRQVLLMQVAGGPPREGPCILCSLFPFSLELPSQPPPPAPSGSFSRGTGTPVLAPPLRLAPLQLLCTVLSRSFSVNLNLALVFRFCFSNLNFFSYS